jgi:hypothetical protein
MKLKSNDDKITYLLSAENSEQETEGVDKITETLGN